MNTLKNLPLPLEHEEQKSLFQWADMMFQSYPLLKLMFAIPNGGLRHPATARKLKLEGVKAGVPDIFLPVPKLKYKGLFVEMKRLNGKLQKTQEIYIEELRSNGYKVEVCFGFKAAKEVIVNYLELKR